MQAGLERFTNTYRCVGKAGSLGCKVGVTEYCQTGPLLLLLLHCCTKTSRPMRRSTQWGPLGSRPPSGKQEVKTESSESLAFWIFTNGVTKKSINIQERQKDRFPHGKSLSFFKNICDENVKILFIWCQLRAEKKRWCWLLLSQKLRNFCWERLHGKWIGQGHLFYNEGKTRKMEH